MEDDSGPHLKTPAAAARVGLPRRREHRPHAVRFDRGERFERERRDASSRVLLLRIRDGRCRIEAACHAVHLGAQRAAVPGQHTGLRDAGWTPAGPSLSTPIVLDELKRGKRLVPDVLAKALEDLLAALGRLEPGQAMRGAPTCEREQDSDTAVGRRVVERDPGDPLVVDSLAA